jgi:hypothetical protein
MKQLYVRGDEPPARLLEPPVAAVHYGRFHAGADANLFDEPHRRVYRQAARRIAFRALTRGKLSAHLLYVFHRALPGGTVTDNHHVMGSWLIADPAGNVTAHRGLYVGPGGPRELANAIIPGSAPAAQAPVLNGYYRERPDAYRDLVASYEQALKCLLAPHSEGAAAGHLYAAMQVHADPAFMPLLSAAVGDHGTQLVLHDWLAEREFPHAEELRSKKWNKGKWTEAQLLDLLTKPFRSTRRSFSGRQI